MKDRICELKCNIDDMTAEELAFAAERLMAEGAKDVTLEPVIMKKGRPATVLTVMCSDDETEKERFAGLMFRYTTTIGIRQLISERWILDRSSGTAHTPYGEVRFKRVTGFGEDRVKAEYEDLAALAGKHGVSLDTIRNAVIQRS